LDGKSWKLEEIERQVEISRNLSGKWSLGNIFFSMTAFTENRQGIYDKFKSSLYAKPALVPTMSWQDTVAPAPPTGLEVKDRKLSWKAADNADIRSWTLYKQNGTTWTLEQIFPGVTRDATLVPGTYALCAVDRMANESVGVLVSVS
jgi:hypothetical protein